jgi:hypothetical protein
VSRVIAGQDVGADEHDHARGRYAGHAHGVRALDGELIELVRAVATWARRSQAA